MRSAQSTPGKHGVAEPGCGGFCGRWLCGGRQECARVPVRASVGVRRLGGSGSGLASGTQYMGRNRVKGDLRLWGEPAPRRSRGGACTRPRRGHIQRGRPRRLSPRPPRRPCTAAARRRRPASSRRCSRRKWRRRGSPSGRSRACPVGTPLRTDGQTRVRVSVAGQSAQRERQYTQA